MLAGVSWSHPTLPPFSFSSQLFPQIEEMMVQPLRDSRDHYEELKQQNDDAMTEVAHFFPPHVSADFRDSLLSTTTNS